MKGSRIVAAGASALLAVGVGVAGAAPAEAVDATGDCSSLPVTTVGTADSLRFSAAAGDVLTATPTVAGPARDVVMNVGPTVNPADQTQVAQAVTPTPMTYSFPEAGTAVVVVKFTSQPTETLTVTWTCSRPAAPIPAWVQAYGRASADDDCPAGYNPEWAGGPSADVVAYSKSWQRWMNDGTGGWVCTRSVPSLG